MSRGIDAERRPDASCVGAVVVTFHPSPGLYDRVHRLLGQVSGILIVDNGSLELELDEARRLASEGLVELVLNGANRGQAAALNQGLAWGKARGDAWVVTFDQDTTPGPQLVAAAGTVFDRDWGRPLAAIGAGWIVSARMRETCTDPAGREVPWAITSGTLHSVRAWNALGEFRSDFFIDYVDIEFCLRARSRGYAVAKVCVPTMEHAYGTPTQKHLLGRAVQPSNYSPARRYFNARNRIIVWRSYWRREKRFVLTDIKAWAKELVKVVLLEHDRRGKLIATASGVRDGFRRITGPLPAGRLRL